MSFCRGAAVRFVHGHLHGNDLLCRKREYSLPTTLGDDVRILGMVCVIPGVTIGSVTVIGGGSVVIDNIPEGIHTAGNPCRVLRKVTSEDRDRYVR